MTTWQLASALARTTIEVVSGMLFEEDVLKWMRCTEEACSWARHRSSRMTADTETASLRLPQFQGRAGFHQQLWYLAAEAELANAPALVIIPYHHLQDTAKVCCCCCQAQHGLSRHHLTSLARQSQVSGLNEPTKSKGLSSESLTLFGENLGVGPPPTSAKRLHLNSSSTIATPAPLKSRRHCTDVWFVSQSASHNPRTRIQSSTAYGVGKTFSSKGSQLKTRKPVVEPQAKHPLSWLNPNWSSSIV